MAEKTPNPYCFSQSVLSGNSPVEGPARARRGRPMKLAPPRPVEPEEEDQEPVERLLPAPGLGSLALPVLVREWLTELRVMGRSPRTLHWYAQKFDFYLRQPGAATQLPELTASELRRFLAECQDRQLSENTVRGFFQVIRAFANWGVREGYAVDSSVLRVRAPKVALKEMQTYSPQQLEPIFTAAKAGWQRMAVQVLLGTGMRISELCDLQLDDIEDDGSQAFLKIRRGKGAKFRRVPATQRLRREIIRYVNRQRPDVKGGQLLLKPDGSTLQVLTVTNMLGRMGTKLGFPVHAHRFRHTFATEYLRRGGEMERLRRILGHTSYVMVMRYVHLDKGDLGRDFDLRAPF